MQLRRQRHTDLPDLLTTGQLALRPLRPPPPAGGRWDEGPLCDPCYTAALRHRGRCAACGTQRRLVGPPGPDATLCADWADCAAVAVTHACTDCGLEDKLHEKGLCKRCSLRRRATELLSGGTGHVPAELTGVLEAISSARTPRAALNWLRQGAAAGLLAEVAAGRLPATHQALDCHPHPRAADYLRHILLAGGVLPDRDEALARTQRWLNELLATIDPPEHRRLVHAFATWRVMRRLRRRAETSPDGQTYTAHAKIRIKAAADFLAWLATRNSTLAQLRQADIDDWLTTGAGACRVREFLARAADQGRCAPSTSPPHNAPPDPPPTPTSAGPRSPPCCTTTTSPPSTGSPAASCCYSAGNKPGSPA